MEYRNFDLSVDGKSEDVYPLRAESQDFGEIRDFLKLEADQLAEISEALDRLDHRETDRDFLIRLGTMLYGILFPSKIESIFEQSYGTVLGSRDTAIRLRLRIHPPEIAALPWEFLYSPVANCFLGTSVRFALVRYLEIPQRISLVEARLPLKALVVIPNCVEPYPQLDSEAERANLVRALQGLEDSVQLKFLDGNVTRARISDALLEEFYHCFHYIGHGDFQEDRGSLLLNSADGQADLIDDEQFASLFQNHETMKLLVLNSCKGAQTSNTRPLVGMAPRLVKLGIPAVVAMHYAVSDDIAVLFAREFYRSLFRGKNKGRIEAAMAHARNRLVGEFPDDRDIGSPVLFMHARQGVLFNPVRGNLLRDMPRSVGDLHTAQAVAETLEHNLSIESGQEDLQRDREELRRLKRGIRLRNCVLGVTFCVVLVMFCLSWMSIFDAIGLDTRVESLTMWLGDMFTEKAFADDIGMVFLSGESIRELERGPWGSFRKEYARLIRKLSESEERPKVIALDIAFESASPEPSYDDELAEAIKYAQERGTSVIVGVGALDADGRPKIAEKIGSVVAGYGVTCIGEKWFLARTMPLIVIKGKDGYFLSLSLKAIEAYNGESYEFIPGIDLKDRQIVLRSDTSGLRPFGFSELGSGSDESECKVIGKEDKVVDIIIDLSPREKLKRYQYEYKELMASDIGRLERFNGKIVLIGEQNEKDIHHIYQGLLREKRYGFELHADAINTILSGKTIRSLGFSGQLVIMACLGLLGAMIWHWMSRFRPYWRIGACAGVFVIYFVATVHIYSQYQILLNTMYHIGTFGLAYWIMGRVERRYLS